MPIKRAGRKRTAACPTPRLHSAGCRACAAQRAARYRQKRAPVRSERTPGPLRQAARRAYAAAHAALRDGTIVGPTRCDRCLTNEDVLALREEAPYLIFRIPRPAEAPRALIWLCRPCEASVRIDGDAVLPGWVWPGKIPGKAGRPRRYDLKAHEAAIAALQDAPISAHAKVYTDAYLANIADPDRFLDYGSRRAERWDPVGANLPAELAARLAIAWRWRARAWLATHRREIARASSTGEAEHIQAHRRTVAPSHHREENREPTTPRVLTRGEEAAILSRAEAANAAADALLGRIEATFPATRHKE